MKPILKPCLLILILIISSSCAKASDSSELKMWLSRLDKSLAEREQYEKDYLKHIDGLKQFFRQTENLETKFDICHQIFRAYKSYQSDSAYAYAQKEYDIAQKMSSESRTTISKCDRAYACFFAGNMADSFWYLKDLSPASLSKDMKCEYYESVYKIFSENGGMSKYKERRDFYNAHAEACMDSLLQLYPKGSGLWNVIKGSKLIGLKKWKESLKYLNKAAADTTIDKHQLAMVYARIAYDYLMLGDNHKSTISYIQSAIYDNRSCTNEITALYDIAILISDYNNTLASRYMHTAINMLLKYDSKFRFMEAGDWMQYVYQERISSLGSQRSWLVAIMSLSFVIIGLIATLYILGRRKNRKMMDMQTELNKQIQLYGEANRKLNESQQIKEEYLGQMFYENAEFIDKISSLFHKISRLLVVKKYDEIKKTVSEDELNKERNGMYRNFDKVFITLFPHFVDEYNSLFSEEERKDPDEGNILTNEMRIFAFIRLGVKQSDRIAKFLGYSVNTVNNYKTHAKNRSKVPNDEFENYIMNIN